MVYQTVSEIHESAFNDPNSYFKHYANLSKEESITTASKIWDEINGLNFNQNILPTRERANLILKRSQSLSRINKIKSNKNSHVKTCKS